MIPALLSLHQRRLIKQAMMKFCKPCCGGSGSGSGSGSVIPDGPGPCCCSWCAGCLPSGAPSSFTGPSSLTATISVPCVGTKTITILPGSGSPNPCYQTAPFGGMYVGSQAAGGGSCTRCDGLGPLIWLGETDIAALFCGFAEPNSVFSLAFLIWGATGFAGGSPPLTVVSCDPFYATYTGELICSPFFIADPYSTCTSCVGQTLTIEVTE